ncbi:MAG: DNA mismatch repair protein MutS [Firmicutes bacterium]|nr:DNA mismatch repair protein MutS [Bacillota bacterium]
MALTPMMKQFLEVKDRHKDCLLFYRLGDFYELFFDDAKVASRELELTLTGRDCGLEERAPMCGVPADSSEGYIAKLVAKGYKVAKCEQLSPAGEGKLVERDVVRIYTPGTVTESSMLDAVKSNYLMSVCYIGDSIGVAWADITTGELNSTAFVDESLKKLNDLLVRVLPAEVICNQNMLTESFSLPAVTGKYVAPFSSYSEWTYNLTQAQKIIEDTGLSITLADPKSTECLTGAIGSLLQYIADTQKNKLKHIADIDIVNESDYVKLNMVARRNLELIETMNNRSKKGSLLWLIDKTSTPMGSRLLKKWISMPSAVPKIIGARHDAVEELLRKGDIRVKLSDALDTIKDIERLAGRLANASIRPREFLTLGSSLKTLPIFKELLCGLNSALFGEINAVTSTFEDIADEIISAISVDAPVHLKDGGVIKQGYNADLDQIGELSNNSKDAISRLETRERQATGIKTLKVGHNRIFGYYIEVTKSNISQVPYRFERKQTLAGCERYTTDELKDLDKKITAASAMYTEMERELYSKLVEAVGEYVRTMLVTAGAVAQIDCLLSFAVVAKDQNFCRPTINDKINAINITEGRHPIVEKIINSGDFVPNDTMLDGGDNRIMIITGPNMSGKSTYMRQVAIIVLLAHIGSFVPAKSAEIGICDAIFTRVGASDDITMGQSTFMVEMSEMAGILDGATPRSLILLDEVGRGTATYDGLSLAWAIVEHLSSKLKAKTLFSTHYHELTQLEGTLDGVKNYKVTVRELAGSIVFLHKVMRGGANKSFGIEVARLAGLPSDLLSRAKNLLTEFESGTKTSQNLQMDIDSLVTTPDPKGEQILRILKDLDPDNLSPRQAFDIIIDLKEKLDKS